MPKVVAYKNEVVTKLTNGVSRLLKSNGVTVINGEAAAKSANEVECEGKVYTAASLILCGGSVPGLPPIPGINNANVLTSNEILELGVLPQDLVILGGGVIGCEIACAFNSFGSNVTIIEMLPTLVTNMGRKVAEAIEKALADSGIKVYTNQKVTAIEDDGGRPVVIGDGLSIKADYVLAATGRDADLSCLGALSGRVLTARGKIVVNDRMETNVTGVFAAGDVTGGMMLAHTAFAMAETAAENAMGGNSNCNLDVVPAGLYTMPEAASVGLDEDEAREKAGDKLRIGQFSLAGNGRSLASGEPEGFVQVMADGEYGEILGVRIVGAGAVEMIAEPAAMMSFEVTADEVAEGVIHAHPTFAEAFMEACADAFGRSVHLPKKNK
jgi:dihydrolipoamide dehydrogenase